MAELGVTAFHRRSFITTRRAIAGVEQLDFDPGADVDDAPAEPAVSGG
jgi:hypothetical protein